jgi:hypothetical protein
VVEWSITTDCKSVGLAPTQVRILPPPQRGWLADERGGGESPFMDSRADSNAGACRQEAARGGVAGLTK